MEDFERERAKAIAAMGIEVPQQPAASKPPKPKLSKIEQKKQEFEKM